MPRNDQSAPRNKAFYFVGVFHDYSNHTRETVKVGFGEGTEELLLSLKKRYESKKKCSCLVWQSLDLGFGVVLFECVCVLWRQLCFSRLGEVPGQVSRLAPSKTQADPLVLDSLAASS